MRDDTTIVYRNPRNLDGDPYQVAEATFAQAGRVLDLLDEAMKDCFWAARNTEMERELAAGLEPDGAEFTKTPLGQKITTISKVAAGLSPILAGAGRAATYNPRKPPKE